jgi:peptidoglycan/LPS O-acetylase OafA/YrhL
MKNQALGFRMKAVKFVAWYALIVGFSILIQWAFFLATAQVPEIETEPYRIVFHLAGEFVTGILLIFCGFGLMYDHKEAKKLSYVALGMLFYTMIVSPGYFVQQGQWVFVVMFGVLLIFGFVGLWLMVKTPDFSKG